VSRRGGENFSYGHGGQTLHPQAGGGPDTPLFNSVQFEAQTGGRDETDAIRAGRLLASEASDGASVSHDPIFQVARSVIRP